MAEQFALFDNTAQGQVPSESLQARLLHRLEDPVTSVEAVPDDAHIDSQKALAVSLVRAYGPGTTREVARRYVRSQRLPASEELETHHMLARRLPLAEVDGEVTCDRVKDAEGKTVSATMAVCDVSKKRAMVWRATECAA